MTKNISNFKKYKADSLKIAKELFYDDDILERIQAAETVGDIERCLICGRKRRDKKYGI